MVCAKLILIVFPVHTVVVDSLVQIQAFVYTAKNLLMMCAISILNACQDVAFMMCAPILWNAIRSVRQTKIVFNTVLSHVAVTDFALQVLYVMEINRLETLVQKVRNVFLIFVIRIRKLVRI